MAAPPSLVDSHFVPTMHCCLSSHVLEGDHDSFITEWSVTGGGRRGRAPLVLGYTQECHRCSVPRLSDKIHVL